MPKTYFLHHQLLELPKCIHMQLEFSLFHLLLFCNIIDYSVIQIIIIQIIIIIIWIIKIIQIIHTYTNYYDYYSSHYDYSSYFYNNT